MPFGDRTITTRCVPVGLSVVLVAGVDGRVVVGAVEVGTVVVGTVAAGRFAGVVVGRLMGADDGAGDSVVTSANFGVYNFRSDALRG